MLFINKPFFACDCDLQYVKYPTMGFPKIDGVRMIYLDGGVTSRSLNPHENIYTTTRFSNEIYKGLDGEATVGDITSNACCRNTTGALNRILGEPDVKWNVFDLLTKHNEESDYILRYKELVQYVEKNKPKDVTVVEFKWLHNREEVMNFYED